MATHYSILAWRIPWTEETSRLQSIQSWAQLKRLSIHTPAPFIEEESEAKVIIARN